MAVTKKIDGKAYTIGDILKKEIQYRVPTYQRDFAWTNDELETLWDDIISGINNGKREYFIGAIVTSRTDESKKWDIVDGQQRLAALSMIFSAIGKAWSIRGDTTREGLAKKWIIGDVDIRTLEPTPKLTLNANNDWFYQSCVIKGENGQKHENKVLTDSNKLILSGYTRIKELLEAWLAQEPSSMKENLINLSEFISDSIYAILIETGDESDAYITFETLNGRGVDLATADLVKNLLFSKAGGNLEKFKIDWAEITHIIGSSDLTQFIRYFWNAYYNVVQEKELYKDIRNTVKEPSHAKLLIERLRRVATYYEALANANHPYWTDFPVGYKVHLEALMLFKVTQYKIIALAAMDVMKPADLTKLLKILSIISFRFTVISGLNTGNTDRVYPAAALAITNNPGIRPKAIFELLKSVYVDDARFEADFKQKFFIREPVARYVLREINNQNDFNGAFASDRVTVEHILPKNPNGDWRKFLGANKAEDLVYLIGNLTLLESAKNREIGNSSFEVKRDKAYNLSKLSLNQEFKGQLFWSSKEIEERSARFAKIAAKIWSLDYT